MAGPLHVFEHFRARSPDKTCVRDGGGFARPTRRSAARVRHLVLWSGLAVALGAWLIGEPTEPLHSAVAGSGAAVPGVMAGSAVLLAVGFFGTLVAALRGDRGAAVAGHDEARVQALETELASLRQLADERKVALETADRTHVELVREVNHRIKNNLQVILSLLSLQTSRTQQADARIALNEARQRISALALIHRHLYDSPDFQSLDFKSFASELLRHLADVAGGGTQPQATTRIVAPSIRITADQAVPVALLVTEAVSQAMAHGFPAGHVGEIVVGLSEQDGTATLEIRDDGLPHTESAAATPGSLAALLIAGYVRQLQGRLEVQDRAPGTAVVVSFAWRPPEDPQRPKVATGV